MRVGLIDLWRNKVSVKKGILHVLVANIINLIVSLFSGFILPKFLSIDTYANIKLFHLYITYIGISHLGYSDGMYLRNGGKSLDNLDKKDVLSEFKTFRYFQYLVTVLAIILAILIKNEMLLFCAIVIVPINISNYIRSLYSAIGQFKKYSKFTNINTICIFLINIFLLFIIKSDHYYLYIIGQSIVYFLYCLFIVFETHKLFGKEKSEFNFRYIIEDIKSGFLLLIGNFCNVLFTSIDKIFVKNLIDLTQFAYYSFATSIEHLLNVFITPISTVMYNYFCNKRDVDSVLKVKKNIMIFASMIIIIMFPAKFIVEIWITKYINSISVLFLLVSALYIAIMIRTVHVNIYKAEKKQNRYFKIMMAVVVISIVLNILAFCVVNSMVSIAVATLLTNIIWYIIGEFDLKKYKLDTIDYLYTFSLMIIFLMCGTLFNSILGCLIYIISLFVVIMLLEKKQFYELIQLGIDIIRSKFKSFGSLK